MCQDARKSLREVSLASNHFDLHLQHHHTLILGDMNYRNTLEGVNLSPEDVLALVAASASSNFPCCSPSSRSDAGDDDEGEDGGSPSNAALISRSLAWQGGIAECSCPSSSSSSFDFTWHATRSMGMGEVSR